MGVVALSLGQDEPRILPIGLGSNPLKLVEQFLANPNSSCFVSAPTAHDEKSQRVPAR
jgi:hypothetical protein